MENSNNKILTLSFMVAGVILGIVLNILLETTASVATGSFSRMLAGDLVHHGVPVVGGILLFGYLQFNKDIVIWGVDVVTEIRRVVWPSRKDTMNMTWVVCIMVVFSGIAVGVLDKFWEYVVRLVLAS